MGPRPVRSQNPVKGTVGKAVGCQSFFKGVENAEFKGISSHTCDL